MTPHNDPASKSTNPTQINVPWKQVENTSGLRNRESAYEDSISSRQKARTDIRPQQIPSGGLATSSHQIPWDTAVGQDTVVAKAGLPSETSSRVAWSKTPVDSRLKDSHVLQTQIGSGQEIWTGGQLPNEIPGAVEQRVECPQFEVALDQGGSKLNVSVSKASDGYSPSSIPWEVATGLPVSAHDIAATLPPLAPEFGLIESLESTLQPDLCLPSIGPQLIDELPGSKPVTTYSLADICEPANDLNDELDSYLVGTTSGHDSERTDPALPDQGIPAWLASHSGSQRSKGPINLGEIAALATQQSVKEPIGILPIARLTRSNTTQSVSASYNTGKYTGPMASAEELFFNLDVKGEFQHQAGETLQAQRTSMDQFASDYTWVPGHYTWASPSFYHRPLYFEQPNLERYGMGPHRCVQPLFSGMHFFGSVALMPYKLLTQHPYERVYSLGNQRPGDRACYQGRSLLGQSYVGEVCRYWDEYGGYQ